MNSTTTSPSSQVLDTTGPTEYNFVEQGSLRWHELRADKYPASECGAVMGVNPWSPKNQRELNAVRQGEMIIQESMPMRRGKDYEAEAREWLSNVLEENFQPVVVVRGSFMASLDGISTDELGGLMGEPAIAEIKIPMNPQKLFEAIANAEIPDHYWFQMCQQAWCAVNATHVIFCAYDPKTKTGKFITMEAKPLRDEWEAHVLQEWERFVSTNHEPVEIKQDENAEWCEAAFLWSQAREARIDAEKSVGLAALKKAEDAAKKRLLEACEVGLPNVAHGVRVGYSEVEASTRDGYISKRVTGKWKGAVIGG